MERKVVVLPQPEGPSRVKSFPFSTSKAISRAARRGSPRPVRYSVFSPATVSMSEFPHAETAAEGLRSQHEDEERADHHDAKGGKLDIFAFLPLLPEHDGPHF